MSKLKEQLTNELKDAMKAKNIIKRDTIRFLMSALKQVEVDERKELSDEDIIKIIQKSLKQREDSMTQYKNAKRDDLYQKELNEVNILKNYLPKQLNDEELENIIKTIIKDTGAKIIKDMRKVMEVVTKKTVGKADNKRISTIVKKLLS